MLKLLKTMLINHLTSGNIAQIIIVLLIVITIYLTIIVYLFISIHSLSIRLVIIYNKYR